MSLTEFSQRLAKEGRMPPVRLEIKPVNPAMRPMSFDKFVEYHFSSSMVVPVDAFSFSFTAPNDIASFYDYAQEGDIVTIYADNSIPIATGIIDQVEIDVSDSGEIATIHGRDLVAQLEDNLAVTLQKKPIWGAQMTVDAVVKNLIEGTRIPGYRLDSNVTKIGTLLASEPGESRLSCLLRYLEPLNLLLWADPSGYIRVGKPDFSSKAVSTFYCNKKRRESNVFSMRATYSAAMIPNTIVVLWSEVQSSLVGIPQNQIFTNAAKGPARLRNYNHHILKTVMTSIPNGSDPQSISSAAQFQAASAGNQTVLQALAKRELARANHQELIVQCSVPGHFSDNGSIYLPNQCYMIDFDRGGILEKMYLFAVDWHLNQERGAYSVLTFCRLGTIVADVGL